MTKRGQRPSRHPRKVRVGKGRKLQKKIIVNPHIEKKKNFGSRAVQRALSKQMMPTTLQREISFNEMALKDPDIPKERKRELEMSTLKLKRRFAETLPKESRIPEINKVISEQREKEIKISGERKGLFKEAREKFFGQRGGKKDLKLVMRLKPKTGEPFSFRPKEPERVELKESEQKKLARFIRESRKKER